MIEYIYKGFKISYHVASADIGKQMFKADGSLSYLLDTPKSFKPQKFHTEYNSYAGAEHEIKKILENYIDFELKNYYQINQENLNKVTG